MACQMLKCSGGKGFRELVGSELVSGWEGFFQNGNGTHPGRTAGSAYVQGRTGASAPPKVGVGGLRVT